MADFNSPEKFKRLFDKNVSRETIERLKIYEQMLKKWQKSKNLIAPGTIDQIWHRHFADSAQLALYAPLDCNWLDMGSGAGFPGLVLATLQLDPAFQGADGKKGTMTLIESNGRKCAFLHEAAREMGMIVEIVNCRIETFSQKDTIKKVDFITARALKSLDELLNFGLPFYKNGSKSLFLKGKLAGQEAEQALQKWQFSHQFFKSVTDDNGRITFIETVRPL